MRQINLPAPGFLSENEPTRFENFLNSVITDEGNLTIPFAYQVELTQKTKNTIYLTAGIIAFGAIATALILKNK